ncbi:MAG: hypothetical protein JSV47_01375 [Deltaproteobacteria bacterium]|jgi:hypothetical protein|nr:MAG: hypothetical protein JSV47_01375 [Deltaproteobacteria bacterium]
MNEDRRDIKPISLDGVRSGRLSERKSKVSLEIIGQVWEKGQTLSEFLKRLPAVLGAADLREVVQRICKARGQKRTVLLGMGAHPIKVGLAPVIIDLMERSILSGVAMSGAGIIHDAEMALVGRTSEDVATALVDGSFGMSHETADFLNMAIARGRESDRGLGEAVGQALLTDNVPHVEQSILAAGAKLGIPVTVHVALGTDIIHIHPSVNPAATGTATHLDFRIFAGLVASLEGGVYLNLGSAVLMPEIFLKALTLVRNLGHHVREFTTVNMDFQRQYRPRVNVVERPTQQGGKGFELIGHHEIMLPLLAAAVIESMEA